MVANLLKLWVIPADGQLFCSPLTWIVSIVGSLVDQDKFYLRYVIHPAELSSVTN